MRDCCFTDPLRPLLHTVTDAIRGQLGGGRVLGAEYSGYQVLSSATAGFMDSLIRDERRR